MAEASRFDSERLAALRRMGRETLAPRMIALFLASAPGRAAAMVGAREAEDWPTLERAAHSLRPSAGQLGALSLASVCQEIEDAAHARDARTVDALLPVLREELRAAEAWLTEAVAGSPNPERNP